MPECLILHIPTYPGVLTDILWWGRLVRFALRCCLLYIPVYNWVCESRGKSARGSHVVIWSIHLGGRSLVPVSVLITERFMWWILNVEYTHIPCCGACSLSESCNCWLGETFTLSLALSHCSPEEVLTHGKELSVLPQHLEVVCKGLSRVGATCIKLEMFTSRMNRNFVEKTPLLIYSVFEESYACIQREFPSCEFRRWAEPFAALARKPRGGITCNMFVSLMFLIG